MAEITTIEGERNWTIEHIVLTGYNIWPFPLAETRVYEAKKWIRQQGYHLRHHAGYAAIRLEKNSYTIIEVQTEHSHFMNELCTSDCICYAAMLLYRRLKRDGVVV